MRTLNFKKLDPAARVPVRGSEYAMGYDLSFYKVSINAKTVDYHTGLAVEIPQGYGGFLIPRSSVGIKGLRLANTTGAIDSDYRGEIVIKTDKDSEFEIPEYGDRIAQLIITPVLQLPIDIVDELSDTSRGTGGFGSSGR